uniref:replication initiator protein A n=1 Tax=Carnobacterium sp. TaxID=48221 RepID=UPI00344EA5F4
MSKYNIVDRAKFTFYQIPKLLIHGEKYKKDLTHSEIIAYSILMDRLNVSIKNKWFDENGNIYFVYSNPQLVKILGVTRPTVNAIKKKLTTLGLLEEERTGRGNRLYLLEPIPTIDEAKYIINLDKEKIEDKSKYTKKDKETLQKNLSSHSHDSKKFTIVAEKPSKQDSDKTESPTIVNNLPSDSKLFTPSKKNLERTKDSKDTKDDSDKNIISDSFNPTTKIKEQEIELIDSYIKNYSYDFIYGESLMNTFKIYSFNDFATFKVYLNKLEFSHKSVEEEKKITLSIYKGTKYSEYTRNELKNTFMRCIMEYRAGNVENIAKYLFKSFKNDFEALAETVTKEKTQQKGANRVPIEF